MTVTAKPSADERVAAPRLFDRLVVRPEIGALLGAIAVFAFFSIVTDQFLSPAASRRGWTRPPPWASWRWLSPCS